MAKKNELRKFVTAKLEAYYNKYTREPRGGKELAWQKKLTEIDPKLFLRWNFLNEVWSVYYEHAGRKGAIRHVKPGESFDLILQQLKREGSFSRRDLILDWQANKDRYEKMVEKRIADCGEEMGRSIYKMAKAKVTTDSVKVGNL